MVVCDGIDNQSLSHSSCDSGGDDTAGVRKRKRPMNVTCEACKQRKVKCDRVQPACGWCAKNDHPCKYKERKKPGLRAGYGRELESRLDRLEALVEDQARRLNGHLQESCAIGGTLPAPALVPTNVIPDVQQHKHNAGTNSNPLDVDPILQKQVIDPDLRPPHARQQSSPCHDGDTPDVVLATQNQTHHILPDHLHPPASPLATAVVQTSPTSFLEPVAPLPPCDLLYALVDLYFQHLNVWLPLLDRKTTWDVLFSRAPLAEADRVLLHAIVAVSIRFSTDSRLTAENRAHYHSASKRKVQLFGLENNSVRSLQALVILTLDVIGTTNGPPAWNLLSVISRSVVQLGLGVELTSSLDTPDYPSIATLRATRLPEPKSFVEDEERRRLFWGMYFLDRYATVATAFEFALDEKEVNRRLPCRDDLFSDNEPTETRWYGSEWAGYTAAMNDTQGHFAYHCELLGILGRIHQFLKRPIDIRSILDVEQWQASYRSLDSELNTWHFSLPDNFAKISRLIKTGTPARASHCGWIALQAAYYFTAIRLNSSAAYPSHSSAIFSSSYSAMQRCLSASESMRQLCHFAKLSGLLNKLGPPFAFSAWVAARVVLVHGSTQDLEAELNIDLFVETLSEMGQRWDVAQRYSEILNRVLQEFKTSQRSRASDYQVAPSVKILADMRRCAYDLDFLISRQSSSATKSSYPTRANTPAPSQLEYLDVFDIFNFPRAPITAEFSDSLQGPCLGQGPSADLHGLNGAMTMPDFAVPNPDTDWLFHST